MTAQAQALAEAFIRRLDRDDFRIAIIGMGYVGLPLARAFIAKGLGCIGFDIDPAKVSKLNSGETYIRHIPAADIKAMNAGGRFEATADFGRVAEADAVLICVPTPLTPAREPDLSFITATAEAVQPHLKKGHLVVLESTTYPGTTTDVLRPILEKGGLRCGEDFLLAFSPEREDPGNPDFTTAIIPKVVGADHEEALRAATALYGRIVDKVVPVSSAAAAEAVKLTENIFRAVNIALVNELKGIYGGLGIDVWEVIDAAKTKPFGFMPFYPGPGLGGHCIPVDPFYLSWKARQEGMETRFIELAGEINTAMPEQVADVLENALKERFSTAIKGARILLLGVAYKKNVDDTRGSPGLRLMEILESRGASVDYHDPFVAEIPPTRDHGGLTGRRSVDLEPAAAGSYDAVLIVTDHDGVDYAGLVNGARLVVDTRNATAAVTDGREKIVKG